MTFKKLGLSEPLLRAIKDQGYSKPTPIQQQAIPIILKKNDILAGAQTGTGKTAGFTLPLLQILSENFKKNKINIKVLVLTPTRELATQVHESIVKYSKYLPFKSTVIFGGVKINPQITTLRKGVNIIVATPGRLLDHISQKTINLSHVEHLVLDEADRMLDMGFINDIKKILNILPKKKQTLLFSATFSKNIKKLADSLLQKPKFIEVARSNTSAQSIKQIVHHVDKLRKRELLTHLIIKKKWFQVLVFTRTKHGANKLTAQLNKDGIDAVAIHGNKSQTARTKALKEFKENKVRVLVATDVAARGIDIDQLPHVVNFELPNISEDYVHRIGRTGRAGNKGVACSLVCIDELEFLKDIEKLINKNIEKVTVAGFAVDRSIKAQPINLGGNRQKQPRNSNSNSRNRSKNRNRNRS